jgi:lambda repressor-like predicted transcriptional regulator
MDDEKARTALAALIKQHGADMSALSLMMGRNIAYIQQYLKRGSPKRLPERERGMLARFFGVDEAILGALPDRNSVSNLHMVPKLAVGASAGPGALTDGEALAGRIGFDAKWLKKLGVNPADCSLIQVQGDSMHPTLHDGDDIMVNSKDNGANLRSGIFVIRKDDTIMVKRLVPKAKGWIDLLSDNADHISYKEIAAKGIDIIGRVIWAGRRL